MQEPRPHGRLVSAPDHAGNMIICLIKATSRPSALATEPIASGLQLQESHKGIKETKGKNVVYQIQSIMKHLVPTSASALPKKEPHQAQIPHVQFIDS